MSTAQHKYDLLTVAPRECEFAGFAKAFKLTMGSGNLIQSRCPGALRVIFITMLAIEYCDRLDQACLAFNRFNQSQSMLLDPGVIQAEDRNCANHQSGSGHNQEKLVEWLALNH
jgi:hypothetical protein